MNDTGYEGGNNLINYDANGNMIDMKDKDIQNIAYNHLNLPNYFSIPQINIAGLLVPMNLSYLYRADGVKLRKTYSTGGGRGQSTTSSIADYLDGFHYSYNDTVAPCDWFRTKAAFEEQAYQQKDIILAPRGGIKPTWELNFVPTAEGFYSFAENRYIYQYTDHLGNARLSYAKRIDGSLEITDKNDYYPFGLNHIGGSKGSLGGYKNYKYQGQELQETGFYSFKWRNYMPDVGRFFNIDPLSEKYAYQSHYNFSENRVVDGRELEGLEWSKSTDGKSTHTHTVIRNQSSYKGDLVPIAERMKSNHEKSYSVNGVKATYSYEFNQNADPNKQFVTSLLDPIGKTSIPIKDEKGRIKGFTTSMIGGLAMLDSPITNDVRVVITTNSNGDLADLEQIGQRSVHEIGHSGGLPHSWEKDSTVPLEKEIQEANAMNSSDKESPFPVPGGTNITITPKQIEKIINNPKIPVE